MERGMINAFFGGVPPGATYEDAVKAFQNAIVNEPDYILHAYELGVTYNEMKKKEFAKAILEKAQKMTLRNDEDKETKAKVDALLKEIK
jgi:tetratricopeptide (TPR) repeat protein